jgi:hypothetical protein
LVGRDNSPALKTYAKLRFAHKACNNKSGKLDFHFDHFQDSFYTSVRSNHPHHPEMSLMYEQPEATW